MSNIKLIIEERATNIGDFIVGRLLPFKQKRAVGPIVFIDHMGPIQMSESQNLDIGPHPHIGLSTLTYLLEGSILHNDSLGNKIEITPGDVNWMTAGSGIVHSERTPNHLRNLPKKLHGLQIWVALPKQLEQVNPSFAHIPKSELPTWQKNNATFKLIAGKAFGFISPVPTYSDFFFIELKNNIQTNLNIGDELYGEVALYILKGAILCNGEKHNSNKILIVNNNKLRPFTIEDDSIIYIFGGNPLPEERYINWNFVASNKTLLNDAIDKWKKNQFPSIKNESENIPYPS